MDSLEFLYTSRASRVVFGDGSLCHLEREVLALNAGRALVICSPEQRDTGLAIAERLGDRSAGLFDRAVMHVPAELVREALCVVRNLKADCAVVVGGGSAIGLGKAIALESAPESPLPILAIPTTYSGSEMTPIFGITEAALKRTGTDARVLPKTVIYDPSLSTTLPTGLSITSGINAMAHAAEGLYARDQNPVTSLMAEEGIRAMAEALRGIAASPVDIAARSKALYASWLCGTVLGTVGMALHHKLCHTLGGSFGLPHAQTHTVILPHALAYNRNAAPHAMKRIEHALRSVDAAAGIHDFAKEVGAPISLKEIGMRRDDLDRAADIASSNPYWNPQPIDRDRIRGLLQDAFDGVHPRVWDARPG
jgi:maleylacetate reductase